MKLSRIDKDRWASVLELSGRTGWTAEATEVLAKHGEFAGAEYHYGIGWLIPRDEAERIVKSVRL